MSAVNKWTEEQRTIVMENSTMPTRKLAELIPGHNAKSLGAFRLLYDKNYAPVYVKKASPTEYIQGMHNFEELKERMKTYSREERMTTWYEISAFLRTLKAEMKYGGVTK
jgi:hypothetical protein